MSLPITAEVHRRFAAHRQRYDPVDLFTVRSPAMIFAPRAFLSVAEQVGSGDVMVMANLGAAKA